MKALTDSEIRAALTDLHGWRYEGGRLRAEFRFSDFAQAFGFMAHCAIHAEHLDHHPDWRNVYNRVEVELYTHDADSVTSRDLHLARLMSEAAALTLVHT